MRDENHFKPTSASLAFGFLAGAAFLAAGASAAAAFGAVRLLLRVGILVNLQVFHIKQ